VETTRGWGKGYFFTTGEKFKDFQFCLLILPAYLPLKFPNGQFPPKIPGPISQAKLKPKKKQIAPFKKKNLNGGVAILLKKSLLVNLITFLANNLTCSRSANIVISTTI
jgi:hypothetical protein